MNRDPRPPTGAEAIRHRLRHPRAELLAAIRRQHWTSHNIRLTAEETTLQEPGLEPIGDEGRTRVILETIREMGSGPPAARRSLAGLRLLDLGCLEGGLALEMAGHDMEVLGVEGRRSNYEKCLLIEEYFDLPNLRFAHLDVRRLSPEEHGTFDAVLCCGLLYHLADPFSFLGLLGSLTRDGGVLFVDTHVAPATPAELAECRLAGQLSALESFSGAETIAYPGRWSQEHTTELGEDEPWDSISNPRSFWPTFESLVRCLYYSGFRYISNIFGTFNIGREFGLRREFSRVYCAARKVPEAGRSS